MGTAQGAEHELGENCGKTSFILGMFIVRRRLSARCDVIYFRCPTLVILIIYVATDRKREQVCQTVSCFQLEVKLQLLLYSQASASEVIMRTGGSNFVKELKWFKFIFKSKLTTWVSFLQVFFSRVTFKPSQLALGWIPARISHLSPRCASWPVGPLTRGPFGDKRPVIYYFPTLKNKRTG